MLIINKILCFKGTKTNPLASITPYLVVSAVASCIVGLPEDINGDCSEEKQEHERAAAKD